MDHAICFPCIVIMNQDYQKTNFWLGTSWRCSPPFPLWLDEGDTLNLQYLWIAATKILRTGNSPRLLTPLGWTKAIHWTCSTYELQQQKYWGQETALASLPPWVGRRRYTELAVPMNCSNKNIEDRKQPSPPYPLGLDEGDTLNLQYLWIAATKILRTGNSPRLLTPLGWTKATHWTCSTYELQQQKYWGQETALASLPAWVAWRRRTELAVPTICNNRSISDRKLSSPPYALGLPEGDTLNLQFLRFATTGVFRTGNCPRLLTRLGCPKATHWTCSSYDLQQQEYFGQETVLASLPAWVARRRHTELAVPTICNNRSISDRKLSSPPYALGLPEGDTLNLQFLRFATTGVFRTGNCPRLLTCLGCLKATHWTYTSYELRQQEYFGQETVLASLRAWVAWRRRTELTLPTNCGNRSISDRKLSSTPYPLGLPEGDTLNLHFLGIASTGIFRTGNDPSDSVLVAFHHRTSSQFTSVCARKQRALSVSKWPRGAQ